MYVQNIVNDDFLDENKLKFPVLWKKAAMWVKSSNLIITAF